MAFDRARILIKGGKGGDGAVSFRHEKFVPFGGPDGGDGGNGGQVYVLVDQGVNNLRKFERRIRYMAVDGGRGTGQKKHGKKGKDIEIGVPAGTEVWDDENKELLADLVGVGERVIVAGGGRGGWGNARFASPTKQAPNYAEPGEYGEERWIRLELKLIADVGIVGFPNVGKSTLLTAVSMAKPEIADYPFTTLIPNLGVVEVDQERILMADIPGIVEGSHLGKGLGLEFLRHIERTRIMVHLIDGRSADPATDYQVVMHELLMYDADLAKKPQVVAINKVDLGEARKIGGRFKELLRGKGIDVLLISALSGEGIEALLRKVKGQLYQTPAISSKRERFKIFRPLPLER